MIVTSPSVPSHTCSDPIIQARRFAYVIFLFIQAAALSHINNKSASTNAVLAVDVFTIFCICDGVGVTIAPVHPVSVPALNSVWFAISTIPATVVLAKGTGVPISKSSHCAVPELYTCVALPVFTIIQSAGVGIAAFLAVVSAY